MASPPGASSPLGSFVDSDSASQESCINEIDVNRGPRICPWRDDRFNDRECSRYFDCPSHCVERILSDAGSESGAAAVADHSGEHVDMGDDDLDGDHDSEHEGEPSDGSVARASESFLAQPEHDFDEANTHAAAASSNQEAFYSSDEAPEAPPTDHRSYIMDDSNNVDDPHSVDDRYNPNSLSLDGLTINPAQLQLQQEQPSPAVQPEWPLRTTSTENQDAAGSTEPRHTRTPVSRERMDAPLPFPRVESASGGGLPPLPFPVPSQLGPDRRPSSDWCLPRWQPDAEVTYCPICRNQFSFFVRKHHCRKCGRVVCNSCSPHRIIIPHQYIVRPAGSEVTMPQSLLIDGLGASYFDVNSMAGGERVRLCNPCVPDPNTAPPQSPGSPAISSPRSAHHRSRSTTAGLYGTISSSNRHGIVFNGNPSDPLGPRSRSVTMGHGSSDSGSRSTYRSRSSTHQTPFERLLADAPSGPSSSLPHQRMDMRDALAELAPHTHSRHSRRRALPPTPQIAEEDECPVCHQELPSRTLPNFEDLREAHIANCVQMHSRYGTPQGGNQGESAAPAAPRRTGMYSYVATEKDCVDDAECTICLEEFTVGVGMARLECLCRFHRQCISAWFVDHPGRCPVHQHDGFGY